MSEIVERLERFAKEGAGVAVLIDAAEEIKRLRIELANARKVIHAAGIMSNVCYNAKQKDDVPEGIRTWLANTQETFDKARDDYLAVVSSPGDQS